MSNTGNPRPLSPIPVVAYPLLEHNLWGGSKTSGCIVPFIVNQKPSDGTECASISEKIRDVGG